MILKLHFDKIKRDGYRDIMSKNGERDANNRRFLRSKQEFSYSRQKKHQNSH